MHDGVTLLVDDQGVFLICSQYGRAWQISAEVLRPVQKVQVADARGRGGKSSRGAVLPIEKLQDAHPELFGLQPTQAITEARGRKGRGSAGPAGHHQEIRWNQPEVVEGVWKACGDGTCDPRRGEVRSPLGRKGRTEIPIATL
jgi:hypothetical protein